MAARNGYFQILITSDKTYLRLFPAVDGGEPVSIADVKAYFDLCSIVPDSLLYMKEVSQLKEKTDVLILDKAIFKQRETFSIKLTEDKMQATVRFYPPSVGGETMNADEIINDLSFKGIKVGVDKEVVEGFVRDRHYCKDYVIANGVEPIQGANAYIEYFFNTNPNTKPKLNEDGSVDFFDLQTISKCEAGQVLATLTPEVQGKPGMRVTGEKILPRDVRVEKLKFASNIELSADGCSLISKVNGHVSLVDDKVFVSDVYEVVDVDTSTGNINYVGNVLIKGNVKTGFKVKAQGDIEIRGVVEAAEIEATGNVTIARGFNGMGKGIIKAGGNVIAKFIQNGEVEAGGYIHSEAILHSRLSASKDIDVTGKKGFVVGGSVRALGNVSAKTIGSEMGGETSISVGVDPSLKLKVQRLEEQLKKTQSNIDKLVPVITTFTKKMQAGGQLTIDQTRYLKQVSEQYKQEKAEFDKINKEYDEALFELEDQPMDAFVQVTDHIYPGTILTINEVSTTIKTVGARTRFVSEGADIRVKPL